MWSVCEQVLHLQYIHTNCFVSSHAQNCDIGHLSVRSRRPPLWLCLLLPELWYTHTHILHQDSTTKTHNRSFLLWLPVWFVLVNLQLIAQEWTASLEQYSHFYNTAFLINILTILHRNLFHTGSISTATHTTVWGLRTMDARALVPPLCCPRTHALSSTHTPARFDEHTWWLIIARRVCIYFCELEIGYSMKWSTGKTNIGRPITEQ